MSDLRLKDVRAYLEESGNELLSEVSRARQVLHEAVPGGWTIAQIVHHLVRTEQVMYLVWAVVPKIRRFPRLLGAIDRTNTGLWRLMGMRTVESINGSLTPSNAAEGRFHTPLFLRPVSSKKSLEELIEWRRSTRNQSWRAISSVGEDTLNTVSWSHPLLGSYTLMEFAQFLGIHESHHLPQIRRIRSLHLARSDDAGPVPFS